VLKKNGSFLDTVKAGIDYENKITTESKIKQDKNTLSKWMLAGNVKLYGEVACNLFMAFKSSSDKDKILDNFLKKILKSKPEKSKIEKQSPEEIIITYSADISENVLTSPAKGLIFSIPSLYTPYSSYSDLSYPGDRYLHKISQHDTWEYPKEFKVLNTSNLNSKLGTGEWNSLEVKFYQENIIVILSMLTTQKEIN
jgi:hypothetical protein